MIQANLTGHPSTPRPAHSASARQRGAGMRRWLHVVFAFFLLGAAALGMGAAMASASSDAGTDFPTWSQDFEQNVDGWIGDDVEGGGGWCGTVERRTADDGAHEAASGDAYAVAIGGACNEFFQEQDLPPSGPYSFGSGYASEFPSGGYAMELDAYLDPEEDKEFTYWASFSDLDVRGEPGFPRDNDPEGDFGAWAGSLRYFAVPVASGNGEISIGDEELIGSEGQVDEAGWYTFRHVFSEAPDGTLDLDIEVVREDEVVFSASPDTAYTPEGPEGPQFPLSQVEASNVGSGYIWLGLPDDTELPIDRHRVRTVSP